MSFIVDKNNIFQEMNLYKNKDGILIKINELDVKKNGIIYKVSETDNCMVNITKDLI